jgi:hypothetical protein
MDSMGGGRPRRGLACTHKVILAGMISYCGHMPIMIKITTRYVTDQLPNSL